MNIKEIMIANDYFRNLTTPELAKRFRCSETTIRNYRKGIRHIIKGWFPEVGARWENWISEQLALNGIPNQLKPYRYPFDILAFDDVKIEVKVARKPLNSPSLQCKNPCWQFKILKIRKPNAADFYILIIAPEKLVFVIPGNELPNLDNTRFCYPTRSSNRQKYSEYINAYHLIRDFSSPGSVCARY